MKGFSQDESLNQVAQEKYSPFGISGTFHHGSILPHRNEVSEIVEGKTQAYEFSFYKSTFGKKSWQQLHNYPSLGISFIAMDLGNERELGKGYGVFSFIELSSNHHRKISFNTKLGYGLGYIEKPFDRETNFKNVAIGSHYNVIIYVNSNFKLRISKNLQASAGLSLIHFSNASATRPNLGINIFSLNTGLSYRFGGKEELIIKSLEKRPRKWTKVLRTTVGFKEVNPADGPKYFVSAYSFDFTKVRAEKSSFGFGVDLFYNTALTQLIKDDSSNTSEGLNNFRLGLAGMYSFDFGKISFVIEMGGYIFTRYKNQGMIYNRIFTKFNANDKLFFTLGLKTHFAVADFAEIGIGYNFN